MPVTTTFLSISSSETVPLKLVGKSPSAFSTTKPASAKSLGVEEDSIAGRSTWKLAPGDAGGPQPVAAELQPEFAPGAHPVTTSDTERTISDS